MPARPQFAGATPQPAVQAQRRTNRQPLDSARQCGRVRGLDKEMKMIGLNRIVNDPKVLDLRTADGRGDARLDQLTTERATLATRPERNVHRMRAGVGAIDVTADVPLGPVPRVIPILQMRIVQLDISLNLRPPYSPFV
jgi:hypothetical protein